FAGLQRADKQACHKKRTSPLTGTGGTIPACAYELKRESVNMRSTSSLCSVSSAIMSSSFTTSSVMPSASACFLRVSYRVMVFDSVCLSAALGSFTWVVCGGSAAHVVCVQLSDGI